MEIVKIKQKLKLILYCTHNTVNIVKNDTIDLDVAEIMCSICACGHGAKPCGDVTIGSRQSLVSLGWWGCADWKYRGTQQSGVIVRQKAGIRTA